jgi:hypothetical protein
VPTGPSNAAPASTTDYTVVGKNFNGFYGYGIIDAYAAVTTRGL